MSNFYSKLLFRRFLWLVHLYMVVNKIPKKKLVKVRGAQIVIYGGASRIHYINMVKVLPFLYGLPTLTIALWAILPLQSCTVPLFAVWIVFHPKIRKNVYYHGLSIISYIPQNNIITTFVTGRKFYITCISGDNLLIANCTISVSFRQSSCNNPYWLKPCKLK